MSQYWSVSSAGDDAVGALLNRASLLQSEATSRTVAAGGTPASAPAIMNMGNDETSAVASPNKTRLLRYIRFFRILVILLTLIAAVSMRFSKEVKQSYSYSSLTGTSIYVSISVEATDSSSFQYFIVANGIAFVYSVVLTVVSFKKIYGTQWFQLLAAIMDLVAVILLSTANAAAAVTQQVAWNGNSYFGWNKFCNLTKNFCGIVIATTAISSLATVIYFAIVVMSIVIIYRRSQY